VTTDCNVFWENTGGNLDGLEMGPTDREVDPLFCDVATEDFRLVKGSPCPDPGARSGRRIADRLQEFTATFPRNLTGVDGSAFRGKGPGLMVRLSAETAES
jgi:hypothetical protein